MSINSLTIANLRNLNNVSLALDSNYNYLIGPNGSGKTTILEAIHLLSSARSFRTKHLHKLINHEHDHFNIFAHLINDDKIGISKRRKGGSAIRVNQQDIHRTSTLAKQLPLQILNCDSFQLIDSSPKYRRNLIDWGVFHVKPEFNDIAKQYRMILKQRNHLLRTNSDSSLIFSWDEQLLKYANHIHHLRMEYLDSFVPIFTEIYQELSHIQLDISYYKGWDNIDYQTALQQSLEGDRKYKYTQQGPHAADLLIQFQHYLAKDVLSRGQQKLILVCFKLAQGLQLSELTQKKVVYLFDDLSAEFDHTILVNISKILSKISGQYLFTAVSNNLFELFQACLPGKMFLLDQGCLT